MSKSILIGKIGQVWYGNRQLCYLIYIYDVGGKGHNRMALFNKTFSDAWRLEAIKHFDALLSSHVCRIVALLS